LRRTRGTFRGGLAAEKTGMSTIPLLTTIVRPDWEELTRQRALRRARYWTALQLALVFTTLPVLVVRLIFPQWDWLPMLWALLFVPMSWTLPLVTIHRGAGQDRRDERRYALVVLGMVLAALVIAGAGASQLLSADGRGWGLRLPSVLSLAVPMLTWPLLWWTYRQSPLASRQMGLTPDAWLMNLAMGAAAGAALGLSLLVAAGPGAGVYTLQPQALPGLLWVIAYEAGLRAPGEELLFRGLVYRTLVTDPSARAVLSIARVVLLNMLIYVVPLVSATTVGARLGIVVYGAALSCTSTLLRHRQHSLLPGLAANVVFSVFMASVLR
jgi:hypothetical protein